MCRKPWSIAWRITATVSVEVIPERVIDRPPSAELRPNQTDQDSLPPYEILDAIMEAYVEHDLWPHDIIAHGYAEKDVRRVMKLID